MRAQLWTALGRRRRESHGRRRCLNIDNRAEKSSDKGGDCSGKMAVALVGLFGERTLFYWGRKMK